MPSPGGGPRLISQSTITRNSQNSCKIPSSTHATGGTVVDVLNLGMCALSVEMHTGKETARGLKGVEDRHQVFTSTV